MFRHGDGPDSSRSLAYADTPATADAQVVVPIKEGVIGIYRQIPVGISEFFFSQTDVINHRFQFAGPVPGTEQAAVGYGDITQADIKRLAALPAPAGKAGTGVMG
jgi:hypothetical protein